MTGKQHLNSVRRLRDRGRPFRQETFNGLPFADILTDMGRHPSPDDAVGQDTDPSTVPAPSPAHPITITSEEGDVGGG